MSKNQKKKSVSLSAKKARLGWVFVSPFVIGFFLFYLVVIVESVQYSFMEVETLPEGGFITHFVGWSNYEYMTRTLTTFMSGLWATVRDMLYSLPILLRWLSYGNQYPRLFVGLQQLQDRRPLGAESDGWRGQRGKTC